MEKGNYVLNSVEDFDVGQTLECGQCFHFKKIDENEYGVVAFGKLLHIKQENNFIIFYDTTEEEYENIWKNYFDLDRNYSKIKKYLLKKDNKLKLAMDTMWGVRILNQGFFEILISFIISQNKQIPHIKQIVATISRKYGNYLGKIGEEEFFGFPSCERMSDISLEDLKECKTGFRAPYIMDAVSKVCDKTIDEAILRAANMNECLENLQQIKGVGEKIGNCVMLFGLEKREVFPIDVWIKRIMEFMYFEGEVSKDEIAAFAKKRFGKYGGYAQQYLFYYGREMKMGK